MLPVHAALLLGSFLATGAIAALSLAIARRTRGFGDRRAWQLLALAAPSLGLGAMGLTIVAMLWRGCMMFTPLDARLSLSVLAFELVVMLASLFHTARKTWSTRRRFEALAVPCTEPRVHRLLATLAARLRVIPPRVYLVDAERPLAFVMGVWAPRLVLSSWMLAQLDDDELGALVAHELAHLRHGDNAIAHVATWLKALSFFLPSSPRAYRALMADRELLSDAIAVTATRKPLALAGALVKVARHGGGELLAAHFDGGSVTDRVERLLAEREERAPFGPSSVSALVVAGLLIGAALLPFYWMPCASGVSCLAMAMR